VSYLTIMFGLYLASSSTEYRRHECVTGYDSDGTRNGRYFETEIYCFVPRLQDTDFG
jgi:hypothetical protein